MPIFRYNGFKTDGTNVSGVIEASGHSDAVAKIKEEGIFPSDIAEPRIRHRKRIFQRIDESFIPNMTRQLSILLKAGVPLIDALQSLSDENKGFYKDMLIAIKENVAGGAGLSRAMEDFGDYFPEFYINMVQAGEQSGTLDKVHQKLADFLENQSTVKAKVRSSMIYPIIMMGVSIVVLSFLFTFVIPKIVKIFKDTHSSLPLITLVLITISNMFIKYWWVMAGGIAVLFLPVKRLLKRHRLFIDRVILKLPGEPEAEFVLIQPFTPNNKDNLIAWLAARSDGEYYGQLVTFRFPKQELIFGPLQIEGRIDQDPEISSQNTLWDQGGSEVVRGEEGGGLGETGEVLETVDLRVGGREEMDQRLLEELGELAEDVGAETVVFEQ